jgi:antirestriction protein ArdC
MSIDIYSMVSDRIIKALEAGTIPWHKPWKGGGSRLAISHVTGKPYSLLNQLFLGVQPGEYITFKQCSQEGGYVRKGENSKFVVFWKFLEEKDEETGEVKQIPYLRYYNVFHISQCEGIKPRFDTSVTIPTPAEADEAADHIIDGYVARSGINLIIRESSEAYYSPATDTVVLPQLSQFESTAEYYSTAFHELTHSTGHSSRLNRLDQAAHFGNEVYSREELVAELGAAALVNHVGLETASSFRNNAAYIAGWLKALQDDKRLVVVAAGKAEKAVKMILGEKDEERSTDNE